MEQEEKSEKCEEKKYIRWRDKISMRDFSFEADGADHYIVTYTSPSTTGEQWQARCSRTFLQKLLWKEKPRKNDMEAVMWYLKNYGKKLKRN